MDELPSQTPENRKRLRSTARLVISRQIAVLSQHAEHASQCAATEALASDLDISLVLKTSELPDKPQSCELVSTEGNLALLECGTRADGKAARLKDFVVSSPDCKDRFTLTFSELDWKSNSVRVLMTNVDGDADRARENGASKATVKDIAFTLTQYALPFTDNTLLRDGNRFGIYMRDIEDDPSLRLMRLSLIWFPPDFIPPRERPTDFRRIRESLKM